mmetsp:Transcript_9603/g.29078  ORF Transcript_9603/g.29078 Transcript_9603/m.29078 type:complete len:1106 (-) Transcript_9603:1883-5200(-)
MASPQRDGSAPAESPAAPTSPGADAPLLPAKVAAEAISPQVTVEDVGLLDGAMALSDVAVLPAAAALYPDSSPTPQSAPPTVSPTRSLLSPQQHYSHLSVASSESSIGGGVAMPTIQRRSTMDDLVHTSYAPTFFDQRTDGIKYLPLEDCEDCKESRSEGQRGVRCAKCNSRGYVAQPRDQKSISLMELECVMMMDRIYDEERGQMVGMEEYTCFERTPKCPCDAGFPVDNVIEEKGGTLFDYSERLEPMRIPFLAPSRHCDGSPDELDASVLKNYGINLTLPTLKSLSNDWEDAWLTAWMKRRQVPGVFSMAAEATGMGRDDADDTRADACQLYREEYLPEPLEFRYSGEWNENNQRHGHGHMRWQIFITVNGKVMRWQYEYTGSWKNGYRHGRGTMSACPISEDEDDEYATATAMAHCFSVDAMWDRGERVETSKEDQSPLSEETPLRGMKWPLPSHVDITSESALGAVYTGSFYPDGSRKHGDLKVHVGMPSFSTEAEFSNADFHEYHSRREYWPARCEYDGDWMRNMRCGYGTMKWKWDAHRKDEHKDPVLFKAEYSGMWKENERDTSVDHDHHDRTNFHPEFSTLELRQCQSESGAPKVGVMVFQNGDRYVGGWKDGKINGRGEFTGHNTPRKCSKDTLWSQKAQKLTTALKHARNRDRAISPKYDAATMSWGGLADPDGMFTIETVQAFTKHLKFVGEKGEIYNGFTREDIEAISHEPACYRHLRFEKEGGKVVRIGCSEHWDAAFVAQHGDCGGRWEGEVRMGKKHGFIIEEMRGANLFRGLYSHGKRNGNGEFFWRQLSAISTSRKRDATIEHQTPLLIRKYEGNFHNHLMHADGGYEALLNWYEAACDGPARIDSEEDLAAGLLRVVRLCGRMLEVPVGRGDRVKDLRERVSAMCDIPLHDFALYPAPLDKYGGECTQLKDPKLLCGRDSGMCYTYGAGEDVTILMWEPLRNHDSGTLKFPRHAVMSWIDYTRAPFNIPVRLDPETPRTQRKPRRRRKSSSSDSVLGICGMWEKMRSLKKEHSQRRKADVLPSRSMMFIVRHFSPGPKEDRTARIPYWIFPEDAASDTPWFVSRLEGSWWRGQIIYARCKLKRSPP